MGGLCLTGIEEGRGQCEYFSSQEVTKIAIMRPWPVSYQMSVTFEKGVWGKEDIKEQPTSRNLSATAARVLQCTCPVAASWKYFSDIHTSPQLTSHLLLLTI
jgi:hypothetical protein